MKAKRERFSREYGAALGKSLKPGPRPSASVADGLGSRAVGAGLDARDLTLIHRQAMSQLASQNGAPAALRDVTVLRAWKFFADAIASFERHRRVANPSNQHLKQGRELMQKRLAAAMRRGDREVGRRKAAEEKLKLIEAGKARQLQESKRMHEQLRSLSHRILMTQEAERKEISRELHDQIAQTLTGINVHLATLKAEDAVSTRGLASKITSTQRIVEKSVDIVHRFARDLRPTTLDDLGLVAALQSLLKDYTLRTGLPVRLKVYAGVDRISGDKQTVLYRVAQAALSNVAQHAKAGRVSIEIRKIGEDIGMDIHDNGKSFNVEKVLFAKRHKRLGVLGMRERVEMVGGDFSIESAPDEGTTVRARIPISDDLKEIRMPRARIRREVAKA